MALFLFLCYLFFIAAYHAKADDPYSCDNNIGNYTSTSTYDNNLKTLLSSLSSHTEINYGFYNFFYGEEPDKAYAIGVCRGDIEPNQCRTNLNNSIGYLREQCPNQKEAIVWGGDFTLWYSNHSIFGLLETSPTLYLYIQMNASYVDQYMQAVANLMQNLTANAALGDSRRKYEANSVFDTTVFETIYGYVMCMPDLSSQQCSDCLTRAISEIPNCCNGMRGGNILKPSCRIRYDPYPFYNSTIELDLDSPSLPPSSGKLLTPPYLKQSYPN